VVSRAEKFKIILVALGLASAIFLPKISYAYPIFSQEAYENPLEGTGRIVCANCHLGKKPIDVVVPRAVLPNKVFEVGVSIPYDVSSRQIGADGSKATINVGSVLILPEGFTLAPKERLTDDRKARTKATFVQPYSKARPNILVIGPIAGYKKGHLRELVFPVLSPDPEKDKNTNFLTYPLYVGGNRGRGQLYPTGEKSNNNAYTSTVAGEVSSIRPAEDGTTLVGITTAIREENQIVPKGLTLDVKVKDMVKVDQPLTLNPDLGGFGQEETGFTLQRPSRVKSLTVCFFVFSLSQTLLVIKKKQFARVQVAETNF
jgi:apocytochrome f